MTTDNTTPFAFPPSTIKIGDMEVARLGFGAMRLPGKEVWGPPENPAEAKAVLKKAIELGINFIDTSWYYGPFVANELIAEVLHPYPKGLVIATKLGAERMPDKSWRPYLRPEQIRKGCEHDLCTLKRERCDLTHLRYMDGNEVPFLEVLDVFIDLQKEGKIRHIGLSNVSAAQISQALERTPIATVQNMYNVNKGKGALARNSHSEVSSPGEVLDLCTEKGIAFLPFFPFGAGSLLKDGSSLTDFAREKGISAAQAGLAWLLARSPMMLPIPGTGSVKHLEENWAARSISLTKEELAMLG